MNLKKIVFAMGSAAGATALAGSLAIVLAAASPTALAGDSHVYPGSMCHPRSDTGARFIEYGDVGVRSINEPILGFASVVCPIPRDTVTGTAGVGVSVRFAIPGQNNGKAFVCELVTFRDGVSRVGQASFSVTAAGPHDRFLEVRQGASSRPYMLLCRIPTGAELYSYQAVEFD